MNKIIKYIKDMVLGLEVEEIIKEVKTSQASLNNKYDELEKATIDGEDDWFLVLKKKGFNLYHTSRI